MEEMQDAVKECHIAPFDRDFVMIMFTISGIWQWGDVMVWSDKELLFSETSGLC